MNDDKVLIIDEQWFRDNWDRIYYNYLHLRKQLTTLTSDQENFIRKYNDQNRNCVGSTS